MNDMIKQGRKSFHFAPSGRPIMVVACVLVAIGYILMAGPGSTGQSFNPDIFSPRRIVIAPLLCLAGYLLMVIGILRKGDT